MPSSTSSVQKMGSRVKRVTQYYAGLAEEYLQFTLYKDAEAVATRALTLSPRLFHARMKRGIARQEMGLFVAALTDFEIVLHIEPKYPEALKRRDELRQNIPESDYSRVSEIVPRLTLACKESGSPVESLDLATDIERDVAAYMQPFGRPRTQNHRVLQSQDWRGTRSHGTGTAQACRFFNHQGCGRGTKCAFSHAPDVRSVRDSNGKNVCLFYLIGKCKWNPDTCIYLHSKDALIPSTSASPELITASEWFNDPVRVDQVLQRVSEWDARRKIEYIEKENERLNGENLQSVNGNSNNKRNGKKKAKKGGANAQSGDLVIDWDTESEPGLEGYESEALNWQNMELASYDIKPWEFEDREKVLNVMRNM